MAGGYCGKYCIIDLTSKTTEVVEPDEMFYQKFLGGYLSREIKRSGYDAVFVTGAAQKPVWIRLDGENIEFKGAKFLIYNSSDRSIQRLRLTLRYLDETGTELSTFPWSLSGYPSFLSPKEKKTEIMGNSV